MTPQENLTQRRAEFHHVIDLILGHLSVGTAEELTSVLKDPIFMLPSEEVSIETQHAAIDDIIGRANNEEQAVAMARRLMLEGFFMPMDHYVTALRQAARVVDRELGEAYLSEANEVLFATRFFTQTINDHLLRKRQGSGSAKG